MRIDRQNRTALDPRCRRALRSFLGLAVPNMDAILISDYQSGVVDAGLVRYVRGLAASSGAPLCVDSQGDFGKFKGVSLLRCNREEAERFLGRPLQDERAMEQAGLALKKQLGVGAVVITRGSQGLSMVDAEGRPGACCGEQPQRGLRRDWRRRYGDCAVDACVERWRAVGSRGRPGEYCRRVGGTQAGQRYGER